jgi:cytochrome c oxidase cbb3-type subunit II
MHRLSRVPPRDPWLASEQRGRVIYGREGCAYCHTEQVRSLATDVRRFGAPTEPWETKYDYPQLWGTRRIGPDLSREFNLHLRDWQLTHLYNPRLVVRNSVMPPYPWLFDGSPNQPTSTVLWAFVWATNDAVRLPHIWALLLVSER